MCAWPRSRLLSPARPLSRAVDLAPLIERDKFSTVSQASERKADKNKAPEPAKYRNEGLKKLFAQAQAMQARFGFGSPEGKSQLRESLSAGRCSTFAASRDIRNGPAQAQNPKKRKVDENPNAASGGADRFVPRRPSSPSSRSDTYLMQRHGRALRSLVRVASDGYSCLLMLPSCCANPPMQHSRRRSRGNRRRRARVALAPASCRQHVPLPAHWPLLAPSTPPMARSCPRQRFPRLHHPSIWRLPRPGLLLRPRCRRPLRSGRSRLCGGSQLVRRRRLRPRARSNGRRPRPGRRGLRGACFTPRSAAAA